MDAESLRFLSSLRPTNHLVRTLKHRTGMVIWSGPFKGMRYVSGAVGSAYYPKLIGCYEKELHPLLASISWDQFDLAVDIGAAEGYYAVGMAAFFGLSRVIAFEQNPQGRALLAELAQRNGVSDRLEIRARADADSLRDSLLGSKCPFILCDVEGFEETLLDPVAVDDLVRAAMLVEIHEDYVPGVGDVLKSRFSSTHNITAIPPSPRDGNEYPFRDPYIYLIPQSFRHSLTNEGKRKLISWLFFEPRHSQND